MPNLRLVPPPRTPLLFSRLRFDPALEAQGFHQLAKLDFDGARESFARLVAQLDFGAPGATASEAVLLVFDILQRLNRSLRRTDEANSVGLQNRAELIMRFAAAETAERVRDEFVPLLNRLLSSPRPTSAANPLVEKAQSFIEENYQRRLSLSLIAKVLNVSPSYLSRIVRRETGTTVTARIHTARLGRARLLLASGDRSISEIAYTVGYQNYRDFYRNFVKYEQSSPRNARRLLTHVDEFLPGHSRD